MLLEARAVINEADDKGYTALIHAARKGHCHIVVELIKRGADVDLADREQTTALICAAAGGHRDCVKVLIDAGADLNHKNTREFTPLFVAGQEGHDKCAHMLIAAGADLSVTGPGGYAILQLAAAHGHTDFIEVLLSSGADPNSGSAGVAPLEAAAQLGNVKAVELLIDAGADVSRLNQHGWTILHNPIKSLEVVKTLLVRGASATHLDNKGGTVLHNHGEHGSKTPIIMALYGAGADPTIVDRRGETAADVAKRHRHKDTAILLDMLAAKYRKTKGVSSSEEKKDTAAVSSDVHAAAAACDDSKDKCRSMASVKAKLREALVAKAENEQQMKFLKAEIQRLTEKKVEDAAMLLDVPAAKYRKTSSEDKRDTVCSNIHDVHAAVAGCDESKDTSASSLADMIDSFKSLGLDGNKNEATKQSGDEYKEHRQSVAAALAPCLNCDAMTVRLCSGCETTHFCSKSCEMAARHVCCG